MSTTAVIVIAVVVAAAIVVALLATREVRSRRLRQRFGPEYERVVSERGDQRQAEAELAERQRRRRGFEIRELDPTVRNRYLDQWHAIQSRFVDDPPGAVAEADGLITRVMRERGYPDPEGADFEQRASDLSVDYPELVQNYRGAHGLAVASAGGRAGTEDYRKGFMHYRSLFNELLGPAASQDRDTGDGRYAGRPEERRPEGQERREVS